jgi:hypothetical protein
MTGGRFDVGLAIIERKERAIGEIFHRSLFEQFSMIERQITAREVVAREAEVAANTARRDLAQKMLGDCVIRSPFAGVVAERMVEAGEYVGPGAPVARVVESGTLRLVLNVPETEVAALVVGQKIEFTTAAYAKRHFIGTLQQGVRRIGGSGTGGDAHRDGYGQGLGAPHDRKRLGRDVAPDPVGDLGRIFQTCPRHDHDELLTAQAARQVYGADIGRQTHRKLPQNLRPGVVTEPVIDQFEVI